MRNRNGFTLVELLAVIAILAILVILALPNVINMFNQARKQTFVTEAKKIYTEAGKKFVSSSISGSPVKVINSEDESKLDMTGKKLQYCIILDNSGNVKSMKVSNGQWIASLDGNKQIEDLTTDDLTDGNLDGYNCSSNTPTIPEPLNCTFDGELKQGAEYVNGQYTYRYMQMYAYDENSVSMTWLNMLGEGWGVTLTDKQSTAPVTSKLCTYINNKPIIYMSNMFYYSQAASIDLSSFNTSNVIDMSGMFVHSPAATIDVSNFDTSNVTDMNSMFFNTQATKIDVSNFDTSKVTNMSTMFYGTHATTINVSNFDTRNVTNMSGMFSGTQATTIDVSKFNTSEVTNMSTMFSSTQATTIDVSKFNTRNVTDMSGMFAGVKATTLDLSGFDTEKVTNMNNMFGTSNNLKTIYASDKFVTVNLTDGNFMFWRSPNLVGGNGTTYDESHIDKTYARIDGGTSSPGYFTLKQ